MRKALINTGAVFLFVAFAIFMLVPALHPIQDPSRNQIRDMPAFRREVQRRRALKERPFVFLTGICCGAGIACLVVGLKCSKGAGGAEA